MEGALDGTLRLGIIGTGSIASAVVEGYCSSDRPCRILVSPRNEQRSRALAERFPQVQRAGSNQEVLDQSAIVLLALRPGVAAETLGQLRFREEHTVLSLIALQRRQALAHLVLPARRVFKILPLPYAAKHLGLIPFFPADDQVAACLRPLGEPLALHDERELHLLWSITGLISPFYALMEVVQGWCVAGGADAETSKRYTASMYAALAGLAERQPGAGFNQLAVEAATPGGLNEMALGMAKAGTTFPDLARTLDAILERFGEPPVS
jgi:pyrroline-5-carboxylate reductase